MTVSWVLPESLIFKAVFQHALVNENEFHLQVGISCISPVSPPLTASDVAVNVVLDFLEVVDGTAGVFACLLLANANLETVTSVSVR